MKSNTLERAFNGGPKSEACGHAAKKKLGEVDADLGKKVEQTKAASEQFDAEKAALTEHRKTIDPRDTVAVTDYKRKYDLVETQIELVASGTGLRKPIQAVKDALLEAAEIIRAIAEPRSVEEAMIYRTTWVSSLDGIACMDITNQVANIRAVAAQVIRDLEVVLGARRGILLSDDERSDGVLRDTNTNGVIRKLAQEEINSGIAHQPMVEQSRPMEYWK